MKKLLIILAIMVMDLREEEHSAATKPCGCACRMKKQEKVASIPEENIILIKLQG